MSYKRYGDLPKSSDEVEPFKESPHVLNIKTKEEKKVLTDRNRVCIVDIYQDTCSPCKQLAPHYAKFADKYGKPLECCFMKEDASLGITPSVKSVPTIHFYLQGRLVGEIMGPDIAGIEKKIIELLGT